MAQVSSLPTECNGDDKFVNGSSVDVCDRSDVDEMASISTSTPSRKRAGSSCIALKNAVKNLASLDDFVCEKLGTGFFSDVYKVTHRLTFQVMVLKMNTLSSNRRNMLSEVQLLNKLMHPNILRFMGVCVHEGQLHALTEFCSGGTLESLLLNSTIYLDWLVRCNLVLDIAEGMQYLHSKGIMHRDLTSLNCLIKNESINVYHAVIGDFGLACKIPRDNDSKFSIVGSPYWMAPECLKGLKYNERADLFSYGIILCETIARIPADPDVLPRLENFGVDRDTFTLLCGDCPNEFLHVAFKCCEIDPLDRLPFTEIVDQINDILTALKHDISHGMSPDEEVEALISQEVVKGHKRAKSESGTPSPPLPPPPPLPARSPVLHAGLSRCSSEKSTSGLLCATPGGVRCNPFINTPFGRNKLISTSDNSSVFEMSPSTPPSSPVFPHEVLATLAEVHRQRRKSRSLPTSPELQRRSITNSTSSDESMLSWSLSYSCRGSKSSMSSGLLGLSNKDKMSDVIPKDSHKTHDIHIGSRRLDSGLSSLYDEDLEHASEIGNVSISKVREKLEESLSINPLNSSYSSTCSSSLSARYSQDIDGLPSNWDEKDDGDEASSKKERN